MDEPADHRSPLLHPAFRAIWLASIFSYMGTWVQDVGESWLMLSMSKSPMLVAMLTTAFTVPSTVLLLPAGVLSDRADRLRVLVWSQAGMGLAALLLAAATWLGFASPALLLVESALLGVGVAITSPPWQGLVPEIAGRRHLAEAVTLNSIAFNIARAVGPALGGLLLGLTSPALTFAINAVSFFAVVIVLVGYEDFRAASARARASAPRHEESLLGALVAPIRHLVRTPHLRPPFFAMMSFAFAAVPTFSMLPVLAKHGLGASARGYGLMLGAVGAGAVFAGVVLRGLRERVGPRLLVALAMLAYGAGGLALSATHSEPVALALLVPVGMGWLASLSSLNALVQLQSPPWLKARIMALYQFSFFAVWSVGATVGGAVATRWGERTAIAAGALGVVGAGLIALRSGLPASDDDVRDAPSSVRPPTATEEHTVRANADAGAGE